MKRKSASSKKVSFKSYVKLGILCSCRIGCSLLLHLIELPLNRTTESTVIVARTINQLIFNWHIRRTLFFQINGFQSTPSDQLPQNNEITLNSTPHLHSKTPILWCIFFSFGRIPSRVSRLSQQHKNLFRLE